MFYVYALFYLGGSHNCNRIEIRLKISIILYFYLSPILMTWTAYELFSGELIQKHDGYSVITTVSLYFQSLGGETGFGSSAEVYAL